MTEIEKEYPIKSERQIRKVDWCVDDTIFLIAVLSAVFVASLFLIS